MLYTLGKIKMKEERSSSVRTFLNFLPLLLGMYNSTLTLKNSLELAQKLNAMLP